MSDNTNTTSNETIDAKVCQHCGQVLDKDAELVEVHTPNGIEHWCEECTERDAWYCDHCETWNVECGNNDVEANGTTENWCDDCVSSDAAWCERCETYHPSDEVREVHYLLHGYRDMTEYWCEDCIDNHATTCDDCGDTWNEDDIREHHVWGEGYRTVCPNCIENDYYYCQECGSLVMSDDVQFDDYDDPHCPDCYRPSDNVQSYHHTSGTTFWTDDMKPKAWNNILRDREERTMFLGVELETDYNDDKEDLASDIVEHYDGSMVECKEDGSLDEEGLEIVSQPMTAKCHLENGMWERITTLVREHGGKSHDAETCGLHIHISRAYFKNHDAVYRLDRLFHRFEDKMVRFSRRTTSMLHWCGFGDHSDLAAIKDVVERKEKWSDKKRCAGRYEAINDTNTSTVEVRLWRGTLNMETLRATIEFTAGLAMVANAMTDELAETLTWPMVKLLVRFALEQEGLPHSDLDAYLKRREL